MKKFLTQYTGGQPFNLADIRWLTSGLFDNTLAFLSTIVPANEVVILSGCDRSVAGTTVSITSGWIAHNGEVFRVAAHSFSIASGTGEEYWATQTLFDPTGLKSYASGASYDTYQEIVYRVVYLTPPVSSTVYSQTKRFVDLVTSSLVKDTWQEFKSQTWSAGSAFGVATFKLYCMKDLNGFVHIQGDFGFEDPGSGAVDILVGTLPVGYRPTTNRERLLSSQIDNLTGEIGYLSLTIATNGEIRIKSAFIGYADVIDFSQMQPFIAAV